MPSFDTPPLFAAEDWERLDRYFGGELTADEVTTVERWLAADPRRRVFADTLRSLAAGPSGAGAPDAAVDRFRARVQRLAPPKVRPPARVLRPDARPWGRGADAGWRAAAIAVSLLVVLGIGVPVGMRWHLASGGSAGHEYATAAGQRLSVTLVDGTQLTLAPASRVQVAADAREVALEGEAYFTVVHDAAHPFTVRALGAVVRDVGTAFEVRAYPGEAEARVVVADGRVALIRWGDVLAPSGVADSAALRAGDVATVGQRGVAVEHGADVASLTAWTAGDLRFRDAPVSEIAAQLERWYGLEITIADSMLGAHRMTLSVRDNTVDETLGAIAALAHARYERHGTHVTFFRNSEDH